MRGRMIGSFRLWMIVFIAAIGLASRGAIAQSAKPGEWEKTVELARKEGKVVVAGGDRTSF